jgi:hypothetical protein
METLTVDRPQIKKEVSLMDTLKQARAVLLNELSAYSGIRDYDKRGQWLLNTVHKLNDQIVLLAK